MKPSERITDMIERFANEYVRGKTVIPLPQDEEVEVLVAALTKLVDEAVREAILTTANVFSKQGGNDETI